MGNHADNITNPHRKYLRQLAAGKLKGTVVWVDPELLHRAQFNRERSTIYAGVCFKPFTLLEPTITVKVS